MASRVQWFAKACEIATMLQGEPEDQRSSVMARLLVDVQDELEAGVGNRQAMREAMETFAQEGYSVKVPPPDLRLVEEDGK